ncbi:MAG TPA: MXAN_5187 C-terminal domain-containing protein [Vicinamibacterales bacterium]|nr:MXAN_5187 C-terminal domain-containing protein [Vicinamibacterales bacterium]
MAEQTDIQRDLDQLTSDLKRLEGEYNMFFAGRLPRPPWETRSRVEALLKRYDRNIQAFGTGDRFRFENLQARFQKQAELWDRGLRAREEGRPGPFRQPPPKARPTKPETDGKVVHVTAFTDPVREMDKLHTLYDSLMDARRQSGEDAVPFHKFAALVKNQVTKLRDAGSAEVAFRVAVKDGKVALTVRGLKGAKE